MSQLTTTNLPWQQAQPLWASQLNPVLANPIVNSRIITNVVLTTGNNTINTLLGRKLQGYIVILKSADVTIYDTQSTNPKTDLTLQLVASGPATISLLVF